MDWKLRKELSYRGEILYAEHHESHAASAFFPSPFEEAAILTMDGVGEWATASIGLGRGNDFELRRELRWPDSLGLLYSAFTYYLGFKVNSGEYKVMGLAPYGEPKYVKLILDELMELREDGSFTLNQKYFNYLTGLTMTSAAFDRLFGGPPRSPESLLEPKHMDIARSIQEVCEEVMLRMARTAHRETGSPNLCLAGGVALNCVGNGRILREGPFKRLWIQPAAGDAGGALGVATLIWHRHLAAPRQTSDRDGMKGAHLGPEYSPEQVRGYLDSVGAVYQQLPREELMAHLADLLAGGKVIGWFAGRMEFGPRALGARSILGDPRNPDMQTQMNLKIKFRESFRPFAPSVLRNRVGDYFELDDDSPYMLLVAPVRKERRLPGADGDEQGLWGIEKLKVPRSEVPAITHVDYSARIQTVSREDNAEYHDLLRAFDQRTGCPVLVNTSFNVRGEPIVCTPADAYRCFMRTNIDHLVLWPYVLDKARQPEWRETGDWRRKLQLD
jgi:carbamoyltransferase